MTQSNRSEPSVLVCWIGGTLLMGDCQVIMRKACHKCDNMNDLKCQAHFKLLTVLNENPNPEQHTFSNNCEIKSK